MNGGAQPRRPSLPGESLILAGWVLVSPVPRGVRGDGFDLLRRRVPLSDDVTILGFEIVGAESCLSFHSWHCHGYADEVADALDVRTNHDGLIPTRPAARSALAWMLSRPTDESPMPVPWTVAALATIGPP